jgi:DeoR/GlpR family transcriptional regulator of sugar metabolism
VAVAKEAAKLIEGGQVVIIDGGATAMQVVRRLSSDLEATIITHSPPIAAALAEHPRVEVVVIGGSLHKDGIVTLGAETIRAFSSVNADLCLQGIWSLHPEVGISHPNYEEAQVKRAMIESSDRVVALASADKLGTASSFVVAPANAVTHLVTESSVPDEVLDPFREVGVTVLKG